MSTVKILVVGGGGGGGYDNCGGGGAGGYVSNLSLSVRPLSYSVVVGTGGAASQSGGASSFSTVTALGGGAGGNYQTNGTSGGSGGGAGGNISGGQSGGIGSQGANGGNSSSAYGGAGGGGAGASGASPIGNAGGAGGAGLSNSITGSSVTYAGGGGGSSTNQANSSGGAGGGGSGSGSAGGPSTAGLPNTGGGGGAGGDTFSSGSPGGSGVVIISFNTNEFLSNKWTITESTGSVGYKVDGPNTYYVFTDSGTFTISPSGTGRLTLSSTRMTQPQGVVGPDTSIQGLVSLYNGATNSITIGGSAYSLDVGTKATKTHAEGRGLVFPNSAGAAMTLPTGALTNGRFTRIALVNWVSGRSTISSNQQVNSCALEVLSTGALNLTREDSADAATSSAGAVVAGETFVFGASWDGATAKVFKNGVLLQATAYATGFAATNVPKFGVHVGGVYPMNGTIIGHADFNVALSDEVIAEFSRKFWQLFAPVKKNVPTAYAPRSPWPVTRSRILSTSTGAPPTTALATRKRVPRVSQPQGAVRVDWSNPLARGLVALHAPGQEIGDVLTGSLATAVTGKGIGYKGSMRFTVGRTYNLSNPHTVFTLFIPGSPVNQLAVHASHSTAGQLFWLGSYHSGEAYVTGAGNLNVGTHVVGVPNTMAGVYEGAQVTGFFNGVQTASGAVGSTSGTGKLVLMGYPPGGYHTAGTLVLAVAFERALTAAEIQSLHNNPWQLFAPVNANVWVGP